MAETTISIGHGGSFAVAIAGSPETFPPVDGAESVSFGSNKVDTIDNTELGTSGHNRTFQGGLEDSGDCTVKIFVRPGNTSQAALIAAKDTTAKDFKVVYPATAKTRAFSAIIVSIDEDMPNDKKPMYTVKLKITGAITDTYLS